MKKLTKKDFIYMAIITTSFILFAIILTNGVTLYGSTLDWYGQHVPIAEYFRTLFYDTKDLLPDFAANIGAGQNIYNFSYYGFLSPIILISYLFPKVSMTTYIIVSTISCCIISALMLYLFLKKKNYSSEICFISSFIFIMSGALTLHSHRHIMFITYLPFLILGLFGVDKKVDNNKGYLLTIATFLMIMTNYYFSIGGIGCLFLYGLYRYLNHVNKVTLKSFCKAFFNLLVPILLGIVCSSIIILPTLATIVNNRAKSNIHISIKDLIIPNMNTDNLLYDGYGPGLTAIAILSLINCFKKNKANITLGVILSLFVIFNIFNYALNGTMYIDSKTLIPFLPLYILTIAEFLKDVFDKKINIKVSIISVLIISVLIFLYKYASIRYIVDISILTIVLIAYYKFSKKIIIVLPIILFAFFNAYFYNQIDSLVLKETAKENETLIKDSISSITSIDNDMYRISNGLYNGEYTNKVFENISYYNDTIYSSISNQLYNKFYYDTLANNIATRNRALTISTPNLLSLMLNNNKYYITMNKPLYGYELVSTNKGLNIYKNDNVLPYGFASNNIMSYEDFEKLPDQVKQEALLNVIVADSTSSNNFVSNTKKVDFDYTEILKNENVKIEDDGSLSINVKDSLKISYDLPEEYHNKIIFIRFKMNKSLKNKDLSIKINSVKNKLTASNWKYYNDNEVFDYVLASQDQTKLVFSFTEGEYNISDFETYILDYTYIENCSKNVSKFIVDKEKTKGDIISGKINVVEDSYFMISIPYDKGFTIKVDGQKIKYEKVDNAYLGFKISEGTHNIEIEYNAPLKNIALIASSIGILFFVAITFLESKRKIA